MRYCRLTANEVRGTAVSFGVGHWVIWVGHGTSGDVPQQTKGIPDAAASYARQEGTRARRIQQWKGYYALANVE